MRIASFAQEGRPAFGVVRGDRIVVCRGDLFASLEAGRFEETGESVAIGAVSLLPVIPRPGKILCVGVNYELHRLEMGREKPKHPVLFVRVATTLVGHGAAIVRPQVSDRLDYEGELAVIVGRRARHVPVERALEVVAGYTCFNDATLRDWQKHTSQFTPGKNFDRTGGFGPWMVTADEIPDPSALTLETRVNGERVQHTTTGDMTFPIPELLAYISMFTTLEPGDVIATGTPAGVGDQRKPPRYLVPGDRVEVEVDAIGTLMNPIAGE